MTVTQEQLPWDSDDIAAWGAFLTTRTGQRLIPKLAEEAPELLPGGDTNAICIRSGEVRGIQQVLRSLLALTAHPPQAISEPATQYPPLTDDAAWNDGQKLVTQPQ